MTSVRCKGTAGWYHHVTVWLLTLTLPFLIWLTRLSTSRRVAASSWELGRSATASDHASLHRSLANSMNKGLQEMGRWHARVCTTRRQICRQHWVPHQHRCPEQDLD